MKLGTLDITIHVLLMDEPVTRSLPWFLRIH